MMDYCVSCGCYVPEGRQVCLSCERKTTRNNESVLYDYLLEKSRADTNMPRDRPDADHSNDKE